MAIPRLRSYEGLPLLSYGFRPFFLLGAIYAGLGILIWLPQASGLVWFDTTFAPVDWHIHEMMFGYLAAVVTGFLLTSIPNWTGRLPVQGRPLMVLVLLWLAGRVAIAVSAQIGWLGTAIVDCAFLAAVLLAASIEIVAGRNWRNLKVVGGLAALFAANVLFHLEAHYSGLTDYSRRLGIGAAIMLIMIVGGRIVPSFTRNWLAKENPGRLPHPFARFDLWAMVLSGIALMAWVIFPDSAMTGLMMLGAAALQAFRMTRWAGDRTARSAIVLVLHVAYGFIPLGFVLAGLAPFYPQMILPAAGLHAFAVGAIGLMTLAVMQRATLGHTGHRLAAGPLGATLFVAIALSALLRIALALDQTQSEILLWSSGILWIAGFFGFAAMFGPMLLRKRA